jgi:hypothetical protein
VRDQLVHDEGEAFKWVTAKLVGSTLRRQLKVKVRVVGGRSWIYLTEAEEKYLATTYGVAEEEQPPPLGTPPDPPPNVITSWLKRETALTTPPQRPMTLPVTCAAPGERHGHLSASGD